MMLRGKGGGAAKSAEKQAREGGRQGSGILVRSSVCISAFLMAWEKTLLPSRIIIQGAGEAREKHLQLPGMSEGQPGPQIQDLRSASQWAARFRFTLRVPPLCRQTRPPVGIPLRIYLNLSPNTSWAASRAGG